MQRRSALVVIDVQILAACSRPKPEVSPGTRPRKRRQPPLVDGPCSEIIRWAIEELQSAFRIMGLAPSESTYRNQVQFARDNDSSAYDPDILCGLLLSIEALPCRKAEAARNDFIDGSLANQYNAEQIVLGDG